MRLSTAGRPDEAAARATLRAALDGGITFIDTADVYALDEDDLHHNERLIAAVLAERAPEERDRVVKGLRRHVHADHLLEGQRPRQAVGTRSAERAADRAAHLR